MNLDPILSETLDAATKGYPLSSPALPISAIGAQHWSVLAGDLPLPLAVIRDSALAQNHAWMRDFTASTGVLLAPHGKTTMAPQIFAQAHRAGRAGRAGRPHGREDLRRGARHRAWHRGEPDRVAVGPRMLRRAPSHRRLGPRPNRRRCIDAARARRRTCLRPRGIFR